MIKLNIENIEEKYLSPIKILGDRYGFKLAKDGLAIKIIHTQAGMLKIERQNEITITYQTDNDIFRAIGQIVMALKEGKDKINYLEEKQFSFNGVMVDCSRNGVMNIKYAKELIETLSIMGHNTILLYMEDVYELENEPYFGYMRGRYTKAELKEIDDYAYDFGIEVIPCIQTLAHLEEFLKWDGPRDKYIDIDNILCVNIDETRELINQMFKTLSSCFRSKRIHVGMDEAYNLGRGRYLDRFGLKDKSDIMKSHLKDILEIAKQYDLRPMIWDDMFFSHYSSAKEGDLAVPEGIDLMYWDYYNNTKEHYVERIEQRRNLDRKVMFAGGAWRWIGYVPHHSKTFVATNAALEACKEQGVKEVIATAWGDDGNEAPLSVLLFGASLFAEHGYHKVFNLEAFKKRLEFYTGISYDDYMKQENFDILPDMPYKANTTNVSKYMFYEDPLCSLFIHHVDTIKIDLTTYYSNLEEEFTTISKKYKKGTNNYIVSQMYRSYAKVLKHKWDLSKNIFYAYKEDNKEALESILQSQIKGAIEALEDFGQWRFKEWQYCNKSFGYEVLDRRIGGNVQRLRTTSQIIQAYIDGDIDIIEELEEKRLPVTHHKEKEMGDIVHFNQAQKAMTASKMVW